MKKRKHVLSSSFAPILKYPGGKESELPKILPIIPEQINRYYEPFVGAGAVYFSIEAEQYLINDKSSELIRLYQMVKSQDSDFIEKLKALNHNWKVITNVVVVGHAAYLIGLYKRFKLEQIDHKALAQAIVDFVEEHTDAFNGMFLRSFNVRTERLKKELTKNITAKMKRMKKLEAEQGDLSDADLAKNIESAFKSAFYMHFRYLYNTEEELLAGGEITEGFATAIYVFIRLYCYSSMYRYNRGGEFNVPYGGISYNSKSMEKYIAAYTDPRMVEHLNKTTIGNLDFYDFVSMHPPCQDDFVFIDPPYDSEFSTYAKNLFGKSDQERLADYLIYRCRANFMVIIKNTDYIRSLYPAGAATANGQQLHIGSFSKKYLVSFQDRNDKNAEHLIITNYEV